jgi:hypothetical protein
MSSGKKLSILNNHFNHMLIAMLGGTGARVIAKIEDIHGVFMVALIIAEFTAKRKSINFLST